MTTTVKPWMMKIVTFIRANDFKAAEALVDELTARPGVVAASVAPLTEEELVLMEAMEKVAKSEYRANVIEAIRKVGEDDD